MLSSKDDVLGFEMCVCHKVMKKSKDWVRMNVLGSSKVVSTTIHWCIVCSLLNVSSLHGVVYIILVSNTLHMYAQWTPCPHAAILYGALSTCSIFLHHKPRIPSIRPPLLIVVRTPRWPKSTLMKFENLIEEPCNAARVQFNP